MVRINNWCAIFLSATLILSLPVQAQTSRRNVDVLVVGGTTSGTAAALASARCGAATLVVESTPMLGGMLSAQGVSAIDGNHALSSGIWCEFREALRLHYGGAAALATGWVSHTLFEPHVADRIFKAMAAVEPQLDVLYGYRPEAVYRQGKRVRGVRFVGKNGERLVVKARVTVDATDLGDLLPLSRTEYHLGMDARADTGEELAPEKANDIVQDLTYAAILKDYGVGVDKTIPRPADYNPAEFSGALKTASGDPISAEMMLGYGRLPNGKYMINWPVNGNDIYLNVVESSDAQRECALRAARQKTLRFIYYIQHELGFSHLGIADDEFATADGLPYKPYHREGRRLDGVVRMTLRDVTDRYSQPDKLYRTGISVGDYPVDHHHECRPQIGKIPFPPVPSFSVPMGALIPEQTENLIVADKAISVSNLINGSTRLQPVVLLTGQAAGTLAALAVQQRTEPRKVAVRQLQRALLAQKAYIVPLYDVKPEDPDFEVLQRIAATGILRMTGEPYQWANRSWFYPEQTISVGAFCRGLHDFYPQIPLSEEEALLTRAEAVAILRRAGGVVADCSDQQPISRRELARMVDRVLHPFDRDVDFWGN